MLFFNQETKLKHITTSPDPEAAGVWAEAGDVIHRDPEPAKPAGLGRGSLVLTVILPLFSPPLSPAQVDVSRSSQSPSSSCRCSPPRALPPVLTRPAPTTLTNQKLNGRQAVLGPLRTSAEPLPGATQPEEWAGL